MTGAFSALCAIILLAACASPAVQTSPQFITCGDAAAYYQGLIGKPLAGAVTFKPHRVLKPGSVMTMDFNPLRLNVYVNDNGTILKAACG